MILLKRDAIGNTNLPQNLQWVTQIPKGHSVIFERYSRSMFGQNSIYFYFGSSYFFCVQPETQKDTKYLIGLVVKNAIGNELYFEFGNHPDFYYKYIYMVLRKKNRAFWNFPVFSIISAMCLTNEGLYIILFLKFILTIPVYKILNHYLISQIYLAPRKLLGTVWTTN